MKELGHYPWSGHNALMGRVEYGWQVIAYVLEWFGKSLKQARQVYQRFVEQGIGHQKVEPAACRAQRCEQQGPF